jgi:hypothetical protein
MLQYAGPLDWGQGEGDLMRIEQPHALGRQEAISRVDRFLDRLIQEPPGGVTVKNPRKDWDGNRMTFSIGIAKGFFGITFRGSMDVTDDCVVLEADVPPLVRSILGEDRIRKVIADHLGTVLK